MTVAPWFYRNVVNPESGPIVRLATRQIHALSGKIEWEALAYLHPKLRPAEEPKHFIYGTCDGTGTASTKSVACHKAISEALERWAFHQTYDDIDHRARYGLDVEPTTTGFAAWPGLFSYAARHKALLEAAERWSIASWWTGNIAHESIPSKTSQAIAIQAPFAKTHIVVTFDTLANGLHVYGFAADCTQDAAIGRAHTEMERNARVLSIPRDHDPNLGLLEKRLVYFSSSNGRLQFLERLKHRSLSAGSKPKLLVHAPLKGPWNRYCQIWRSLYEPVAHDDTRIDWFTF